jgi:hypothetical protein
MADNAQTATTTTTTTATSGEVDYKALYESTLRRAEQAEADRDTQKKRKDEYAAENAEYKRKESEKMTDAERKEKELQEALDRAKKAEEGLAALQLEQSGLASGFTAEETKKLISASFSFAAIAEVVAAKVDSAVKSAKAEFTKSGTSAGVVGSGTASAADEKSAFQKHQESKKADTSIVNL